jgi:hypothetical protein
MRERPVGVARALEDVAPVQPQRRRAQVGGRRDVAGVEQLGRGDGVAQHGERVDLGRLDGEPVSALRAHDDLRVAERATQPGDLGLQRVAAGVDGVGGPQVLHQPVRAHEQPGVECEAHEEL